LCRVYKAAAWQRVDQFRRTIYFSRRIIIGTIALIELLLFLLSK
jgi:hypothetical protein